MKIKLTRQKILLALAVVLLISASAATSSRMQSLAVSFFAPVWSKTGPSKGDFRLSALEAENQLLKNKLDEVRSLYLWEHEILGKAVACIKERGLTLDSYDDLQQNLKESYQLFDLKVRSYPARVIARSPVTWNSTIWIDLGKRNNQALGREVISKNSPVVVGDSLVGVVEYVGNKHSRVRLITDPEVTPSVRALREEGQETLYLAKGELHGSANVIWRRRGRILVGEGFNYDYEDEYGPARDLRSDPPILKVGDLLVTTGMDGVFAKGFKVATVSKIQMLREGDYTYEIEAVPTLKNLDEIATVTVLPAI